MYTGGIPGGVCTPVGTLVGYVHPVGTLVGYVHPVVYPTLHHPGYTLVLPPLPGTLSPPSTVRDDKTLGLKRE